MSIIIRKFWKKICERIKRFWPWIVSVLSVLAIIFSILGSCSDLLKHAKPQLLEVQDCAVYIEGEQIVEFNIVVNNAGKENCSVVSINLLWPDGIKAELKISPSLPLTLPVGQAERIKLWGYCAPLERTEKPGWIRKKLDVPQDKKIVEGTVLIKFNTDDIIKKKIIFTIPSRNR